MLSTNQLKEQLEQHLAELENSTKLSRNNDQADNKDIQMLKQVITQLEEAGNPITMPKLSMKNTLVILGLLTGLLNFSSILIYDAQTVEIRVSGSFKH